MRNNLGLAFTAGMLATLNPCGFALLPAYLGSFLSDQEQTLTQRIRRAIWVSLGVSSGFLSTFVVLGTITQIGLRKMNDLIFSLSRWATLGIGLALIALGVCLIFGYRLPLFIPRLEKGGQRKTFGSMYIFGISYAIASLGCSISVFLSYSLAMRKDQGVIGAFLGSFIYGISFACLITPLTISLALAEDSISRWFKKASRNINGVSGIFVTLSGIYTAIYGYTEIVGKSNPITTKGYAVSGYLQNTLQKIGIFQLASIFLFVVVFAVIALTIQRSRALHNRSK
jgi:cytochrome c-type biogenesis protein